MLRIRLRRIGKRKKPHYRMVVAEKMAPRDGAFLETLGTYNPHTDPPDIQVKGERAKAWINHGAMPSGAAEKILLRAGVIEKTEKFVPNRKLAVKPKPSGETSAAAASSGQAAATAPAEAAPATASESDAATEPETTESEE